MQPGDEPTVRAEDQGPTIGAAPRRIHITAGTAFTATTQDGGEVVVGPGWLAITEAEYLSLLSPTEGWESIETADFGALFGSGDWVLLWTTAGEATIGRALNTGDYRFWVARSGPNLSDPRWPSPYLPFAVTHWMRLPAAPDTGPVVGNESPRAEPNQINGLAALPLPKTP